MGRPEKGIRDARHSGTKAPRPNQLGELQEQTGKWTRVPGAQRAVGEGEEMEDLGAEGGRAGGGAVVGAGRGRESRAPAQSAMDVR